MLCSNRITGELLDVSLSPVEMYVSWCSGSGRQRRWQRWTPLDSCQVMASEVRRVELTYHP